MQCAHKSMLVLNGFISERIKEDLMVECHARLLAPL